MSGQQTSTLGPRDLVAHIHADRPDLLAVFTGLRQPGSDDLAMPTTRYYRPDELAEAEAWAAQQDRMNRDVYFCTHQLLDRQRTAENAAPVLALWAETDGGDLEASPIKPTAVVESSPGHYHLYARLSRAIRPDRAERLNKRWALAFGADPSGYDLSQLLRWPGTRNHKYPDLPTVRVVSIDDATTHDPDELERILPPLPKEERKAGAGVAEREIDKADAELLEVMFRSQAGERIRALWNDDREKLATYPEYLDPNKKLDNTRCDLALANYLAFYFGTVERADTAFRASKRMRPKWDAKHRADGATYGEMTLERAFDGREDFYTPPAAVDLEEGLTDPQAAVEEAEKIIREPGSCRQCPQHCGEVDRRQQELIRELRAENATLKADFGRLAAFRRSTNLSGKHKGVAEAIAFEVEAARKRGQAEVRLYYGDRTAKISEGKDPGGLAGVAGVSPSTVSTLVDELRQRKDGPWTFRTEYDDNGFKRTVVAFRPDGTMAGDLAAVASIPREKPQHGGSRPSCPNGCRADLIVTRSITCTGCGDIFNESSARLTADGEPVPEPCSKTLLGRIAAHRRQRGDNASRMQSNATRPDAPTREAPPEPERHDATRPPPTNGHTNGSANGHAPSGPDALIAVAERIGWAEVSTPVAKVGGDEGRWRAFCDLPPPFWPEVYAAAYRLAAHNESRGTAGYA